MWPGSVHDSYILERSLLYQAFQGGEQRGYLLADLGYARLPWLRIPIERPSNAADACLFHNLGTTGTNQWLEASLNVSSDGGKDATLRYMDRCKWI